MCVRVKCVFGDLLGDMMLHELNVSEYKQRQEVTNCSGVCMMGLLSQLLKF